MDNTIYSREMPRKPKIPKLTYHYAGKDDSAVEAVYNMLFDKVLEQKVAEKQASKTTNGGNNSEKITRT